MPDVEIQTALGFDFGLKHIGVAVGQTLTPNAQALCSIKAQSGTPDWNALDKIIHEWRPQVLVVGIPLQLDGSEQALTHAARHFANALYSRYQLPVHRIDERLSSAAARAELFESGGFRALNKKAIDQRAAQLILQTWLDQK